MDGLLVVIMGWLLLAMMDHSLKFPAYNAPVSYLTNMICQFCQKTRHWSPRIQTWTIRGVEIVPVLAHLVHCMGEPWKLSAGKTSYIWPGLMIWDMLRYVEIFEKVGHGKETILWMKKKSLAVEHGNVQWQTGRIPEGNWSVLLVMKILAWS